MKNQKEYSISKIRKMFATLLYDLIAHQKGSCTCFALKKLLNKMNFSNALRSFIHVAFYRMCIDNLVYKIDRRRLIYCIDKDSIIWRIIKESSNFEEAIQKLDQLLEKYIY